MKTSVTKRSSSVDLIKTNIYRVESTFLTVLKTELLRGLQSAIAL